MVAPSHAAVSARSDEPRGQDRGIAAVYAAFINSNHAKEIDCSTEFFDRLGDVLSDYGTVQIKLPFRDSSKAMSSA